MQVNWGGQLYASFPVYRNSTPSLVVELFGTFVLLFYTCHWRHRVLCNLSLFCILLLVRPLVFLISICSTFDWWTETFVSLMNVFARVPFLTKLGLVEIDLIILTSPNQKQSFLICVAIMFTEHDQICHHFPGNENAEVKWYLCFTAFR